MSGLCFSFLHARDDFDMEQIIYCLRLAFSLTRAEKENMMEDEKLSLSRKRGFFAPFPEAELSSTTLSRLDVK